MMHYASNNRTASRDDTKASYRDNIEYLIDEFLRLDLLLHQAVVQFREQRDKKKSDQLGSYYISDEEINDLLKPKDGSELGAGGDADKLAAALRKKIKRRIAASQDAGVVLRLPHLCSTLGLDGFTRDILIVVLAGEYNPRYQKLFAYLQDDLNLKSPSVELVLRLLCPSPGERMRALEFFAGGARVFSDYMILSMTEYREQGIPLLNRLLRLDDRIRSFLFGDDLLDSRLTAGAQSAQWIVPRGGLTELILPDDVRELLEAIGRRPRNETPWICQLYGPAGVGKKSCAEAMCANFGCSLLVVDLTAMMPSEAPLATLLRVAFREARLYNSAVYIEGWPESKVDNTQQAVAVRVIEQEIDRFSGIIFLGGTKPWHPNRSISRHIYRIHLPVPDSRLRLKLWESQLQAIPTDDAVDVAGLAGAFRFSGGHIRRAIQHAENSARLRSGEKYRVTTDDLWNGCRVESTRCLVSYAQKITPQRTWDDLVLPPDAIEQLREFGWQIRYRIKVYGEWEFDRKISVGKGVIALFTGPSGTGKTLSAEILAHDLGLDLYKVDLSCVVSKYIGETEKNLSRVFHDAQESNAILFFDEADALFGKRSDIKDAHDRYANIEINYLLQRVDEYEGAIILASNMSGNIDSAFRRRIQINVEFPFPDAAHRDRIWRNIFPPAAPTDDDLDFDFLAEQFRVTGGNIKNVALAAAFRAAEDGARIGMKHIVLAMKREYRKLGRVCEKCDFKQYYELVK